MTITGTESRFQNMRLLTEELQVAGTDVTSVLDGVTASAAELNFNDGATAGTAVASKTMVTGAQNQIAGTWKDHGTVRLFRQVAPATHTGTVTLTAANLVTGIIVGTPAAAANYTLPTGANLDSEFITTLGYLMSNDDAFEFSVINLGADTFTITILTNTGWTLVGNMVVQDSSTAAERNSATFRARRTGSNTWTLYRIA